MKKYLPLTKNNIILLIAESLVEPRYPDDVFKEAESILKRIEARLNTRNMKIEWDDEDEDIPKSGAV